MKTYRRPLALVGSAVFFGVMAMAQQVKTDYDRGADFSRYKTYSWQKVQTADALWVDRIKSAVNSALGARGWTEVESGGNVAY